MSKPPLARLGLIVLQNWDGATERPAPGFPDDGNWTVRWEGLKSAP